MLFTSLLISLPPVVDDSSLLGGNEGFDVCGVRGGRPGVARLILRRISIEAIFFGESFGLELRFLSELPNWLGDSCWSFILSLNRCCNSGVIVLLDFPILPSFGNKRCTSSPTDSELSISSLSRVLKCPFCLGIHSC